MKYDVRKRKVKQVLKYYDWEIGKYNYLYNSKITPEEGLRIIALIKKKFKVKTKKINFDSGEKNFGGRAFYNGNIQFKKENLNISIVCHEMSHLIAFKDDIYGHSSGFTKIMAKVVDYVINHIKFTMRIK